MQGGIVENSKNIRILLFVLCTTSFVFAGNSLTHKNYEQKKDFSIQDFESVYGTFRDHCGKKEEIRIKIKEQAPVEINFGPIDFTNGNSFLRACELQLPVSSKNLPHYKIGKFTKPFSTMLKKFSCTLTHQSCTRTWFYDGKCEEDIKEGYFVRKLVLPAGSEIEIRGDLHGDVHSLARWLKSLQKNKWLDQNNAFKIIKDNGYLMFLGDYVDRGRYGAEVMYIIGCLYIHNPDKVLLVRGNHEDVSVIKKYGFAQELAQKFGSKKAEKLQWNLQNIYNHMPVALFLGCKKLCDTTDFAVCCHGGMSTVHPCTMALDCDEDDCYERLVDESGNCQEIHSKPALEYQWNDFDFKNQNPQLKEFCKNGRGAGVTLFKSVADRLMEQATSKNKICTVFRAHQHNISTIEHIIGYGNGIYRLWHKDVEQACDWGCNDGDKNQQWSGKEGEEVAIGNQSVWTFNVAPRTGYYEKICKYLSDDTVARVVLASGFDQWKMYPHSIPSQ